MKTMRRRGICALLALLLFVTAIPAVPLAVSAGSKDIHIPISFGQTKESRERAFASKTDFQITDGGSSWLEWKKPGNTWLFGDDSLAYYLSEAYAGKYVALGQDLTAYFRKDMPAEIVITTDKVLDLNGFHINVGMDDNSRVADGEYIQDTRSEKWHHHTLFRISKGATLTIIDSSQGRDGKTDEGTGSIYVSGRIISPWNGYFGYYTSRDMFTVDNGNLVIYGGTFQAGHQKSQVKSNFSWKKLKTVIGTSVELGVSVASYATGIDAAVAAAEDFNESIKTLGDTGKKDDGKQDTITSTNKTKEVKKEIKAQGPRGAEARTQTTEEKQSAVNNPEKGEKPKNAGENTANEDKTAKSDKDSKGKNSQIAENNKKIVDSVLDKSKIGSIVDGAFDLVDKIGGLFGNDESTRITETIKGTVVHLGTQGTFVSYGGTYIGHGSTPNTRDAVVEVVRGDTWREADGVYSGGRAYIYDGQFGAYSGADVFAIVKSQDSQNMQQSVRDAGSTTTYTQNYTTNSGETSGFTTRYYENDGVTPIDTRNIQVRGGTFHCYYEAFNLGVTAGGSGEDNYFTKFPGTSGAVGLGVGSYNEKFIKDGRIQIDDLYGNGSLVLLDDQTSDGQLYHYRLFCSDLELRYKQGLSVYPNNLLTNSTNTLCLQTQYDGADTEAYDAVFANDEENIRAGRSTQEKVMYYPVNGQNHDKIALVPKIDGVQYDGSGLEESPSWYYNTPKDALGKPIDTFVMQDSYYTGTLKQGMQQGAGVSANKEDPNSAKMKMGANSATKGMGVMYGDQGYIDLRTLTTGVRFQIPSYAGSLVLYQQIDPAKALSQYYDNVQLKHFTENYQANVKWFTYKIYKVDPLTRENIDYRTGRIGADVEPLITAEYGSKSDEMYKVMLQFSVAEKQIKAARNWAGFQPGEMYRVTLEVEEQLKYNYFGYDVESKKASSYVRSLDTAKASSSVLVLCHDKTEIKDSSDSGNATQDFTALQWVNTPEPGTVATVELVNGKTGSVDWRTRQMFDTYYQWWTLDANGNKDQLIAGTNNIWDVRAKTEAAKAELESSQENLLVTDKKSDDYGSTVLGTKLRKGKNDHYPERWSRDGFLYKNPIAPDDECLDYVDSAGNKVVYAADGLPENFNTGWPASNAETCRLLHAYGHEWSDLSKLAANGDGDTLSLDNNNQDWGHTDSCYIDPSLAGKTIVVEAHVVNTFWPDYFDTMQTFRSHPIKLDGKYFEDPIIASLRVKPGNAAGYTAWGEDAATLELGKIKGLVDGEFITDLVWYAEDPNGQVYTASYGFSEPKSLYQAKFPDDFQVPVSGSDVTAGEYKFYAVLRTNEYSKLFNRAEARTEPEFSSIEIPVEGLTATQDHFSFSLSDIKAGKVASGEIKAVLTYPANATLLNRPGRQAKAYTTNEAVTIDDNGCLVFNGGSGSGKIRSGMDQSVLATFEIDARCEDAEISGIKAPEVGKPLDTASVTVPENANYEIADVYWTIGKERLPEGTVAKNYTPYTINVQITLKNGFGWQEYYSKPSFHPYTLLAEQADGTVDAVKNDVKNAHFDYVLNKKTGNYVIGSKCTYTYTYGSGTAAGSAAGTIDTVNINYPTEVQEGDSIAEYLANVSVSTNGDDSSFTISPQIEGSGMGVATSEVVKAYGYQGTSGGNAGSFSQVGMFIKGGTGGLNVYISTGIGSGAPTFVNKNSLKVVVNGQQIPADELGKELYISGNTCNITLPIAYLAGRTPVSMPVYRLKNFALVKGSEVDLDEMIVSTDNQVRYIVDTASNFYTDPSYKFAEYLSYDEETNVLTPKQTYDAPVYDGLRIPLIVTFDADGDGNYDVRFSEDRDMPIYASASAVPAEALPSETMQVTVTALRPDGSTAYSESVEAYRDPTTLLSDQLGLLRIPEVEDALVTSLEINGSPYDYLGTFPGTDRIYIRYLKDGDVITVHTARAEDLEVFTDADTAYPQLAGAEGLSYSIDNEHWSMTTTGLSGLEPDTLYMLYYRQGPSGRTYTKEIRTAPANASTGVYLGQRPVTTDASGVLEQDGWHYDADTATLTLKNFRFTGDGVMAGAEEDGGTEYPSVIYADHDLTVHLIGENEIKGSYGFMIYAEGNLTITGNGSLRAGVEAAVPCVFAAKDIYLKGTGLQTYSASAAFATKNNKGTVHYYNGEIRMECTYEQYQGQKMLSTGGYLVRATMAQYTTFDTSNAVHAVKFYALDDEFEVSSVKPDDAEQAAALEYQKNNGWYVPKYGSGTVYPTHVLSVHSFTEEKAEEDYFAGGDCAQGASYYKSCACGAADHEHTFTGAAGAHDLVTHAGKPATCLEDGYAEYHTCTKCGYSDFQVLPAMGHQYVHHDAVEPDCTKDGCPAYDVCAVCGYCPVPAESLAGEGLSSMWRKREHDLAYVVGKAATCDANGYLTHYECLSCGQLFEDRFAAVPCSAEALALTATGHAWSEWVLTKAPTETEEGEETRTCLHDEDHTETRKLPAIGGEPTPTPTEVPGVTDVPTPTPTETPGVTDVPTPTPTGTPHEEHTWDEGTVLEEATCTETGKMVYVCTACGERREEEIPAAGHTSEKEVVAPTATRLGYTKSTCKVCGDTKTAAYKAPTGKLTLKAKARNASAEKVGWTNVKTATGYQVQITKKDGKSWGTKANVKAGTTTYIFKKLSAGNLYKFRVRFYIKAPDGKNYFSPWSKTLSSPTLPSGTTITKVTAGTKAFAVQWKKNAAVNGYQIEYSTSAKFAKVKTVNVKSPATLKAIVKKLSSKKIYYVHVRTYKTISGTNYFSAWSATSKVKTK